MEADCESLKWFHGVIANLNEWKHDGHFLDSDGVGLSNIVYSNSNDNHDWQKKKSDIVESWIEIVELMIVILVDEEIIVLLNEKRLASC